MNAIPPSILDLILADASSRASAPVEDLTVESQEEVTWNDGSLGCPEPGMMYTQALVDGYRVVIAFGDKTYDYRGTGNNFRVCDPTIALPTKEVPMAPADPY